MAGFQELRLNFIRNESVHNFDLANGTTVTGILADTWEDFAGTFESLRNNPATIGSIILAPELITIAPYEMGDPSDVLQVNVEERITAARDMSTVYPDSTLILGTPTTDPAAAKPKNSLLYIQAGEIVGQTSKLPYLPEGMETPYERATSAQVSQPLPDMPHILPIISSDLLFHHLPTESKVAFLANGGPEEPYADPITTQIDALLVSACWQRPLLENADKVHRNAGYFLPLNMATQSLFRAYATLKDILVVDRMPGMSTLTEPTGPINVHYRRVDT